MKDADNAQTVRQKLSELNILIQSFLHACEVYEEDIESGAEKEDLVEYRKSNEERFLEFGETAKLWCKEVLGESEDEQVPNSNASKKTFHSVGSRTSSSESVRLLTKTKRVDLETEKNFLDKRFKLEERKMQLEKEIAALQIDKEMAKVTAQLQAMDEEEKTSECKSIRGNQEANSPPPSQIPHDYYVSTEMLLKQQQKILLPKTEVKVFRGDPLDYKLFTSAFDHIIASKTDSDQDRLYYLEQFTSGESQDIVRSCLHMDPVKGYKRARQLLEEIYGNKFNVANSYTEKLNSWPVIKSESGEDLSKLGIFLRTCLNMMDSVDHMSSLNSMDTLQKIVSKLPYELKKKWRSKSVDIRELKNRMATLEDLTSFINKEATILRDPVFGKISDQRQQSQPKENKKKSKSGFSSKSLATNSKTSAKPSPESVGRQCPCCSANHYIDGCEKFRLLDYNEKMDLLKRSSICYGCLKRGHRARDCRSRVTCATCQNQHHTLLHKEIQHSNAADRVEEATSPKVNSCCVETSRCGSHTGAGEVYVAIVPVKVRMQGSDTVITTYAAQDPYSTAAFVTQSLMDKLQVKGKNTKISLTTMEKENSVFKTKIISNLEVMDLDENQKILVPLAYSKQKLPISTEDLITQEKADEWEHLRNIPMRYINSQVEILLGINTPEAVKPLEIVDGRQNEPFAIRTKLGWAINGPSSKNCEKNRKLCNVIRVNPSIEELVKKLYNEDFNDTEDQNLKGLSVEDKKWLNIVEKGAKLIDGHYQIPLPFKSDVPQFPNNKPMALHRVNLLKKKLVKNEKFYVDYKKCLDDLIRSGYVSKADSKEEDGKIWYVPHHGVYHPRKPEKVRVVFDGSAKYKGTSLNEQLLQGPDLTNTLVGVLLRFRQEPVAFMGDIEAMFYQVRVPTEHSNFIRFLWWPDGDLSKEVEEYKLNVHLFGAVSSPSCANYALRKTADDNGHQFPTEVTSTIKRNLYVDDCLKSVATETKAISMIRDLKKITSLGGFNLTKFISSSREVMMQLPEKDLAKCAKSLDLGSTQMPSEKALGIEWNCEKDCFIFNVNMNCREVTRRTVLSIVSSVFDPIGFLGPVVLPAKLILQELCKLKLDWDEKVPENLEDSFKSWIRDMEEVKKLEIKRCMKPTFKILRTELHHFSDASGLGYGAVSYLRFVGEKSIHCSFVFAKSRCAPLKTVTIPRLELTAATLLIRLDSMIKRELEIPIDKTYFWTDSTTVLRYIRNESRRFHVFVANRVQTIHSGSNPDQWLYVDTKSNPSDLASRGVEVRDLLNESQWISGPSFLWKEESHWPTQILNTEKLNPEDVEVKACTSKPTSNDLPEDSIDQLIEKTSSWRKLVRVVAWILRARAKFMKIQIHPGCLTVDEIENSKNVIISHIQNKKYGEDIRKLKIGMPLGKKSEVRSLDPFLESGLLRVGGRLQNAQISFGTKFPALIPKESAVARLLIRETHQAIGHLGRESVLANLRNEFWIVNANSLVRKELKSCLQCRKRQARTMEQKMANLPMDRVESNLPPFTNVGLDYFGPFYVKRGRTREKRYGCIFTCLNVRAIHIEIAESLDTDSFVNALRRFLARRGQVKIIRSDNGTNFRSAQKELKEAIKEWNQRKIVDYLTVKSVKWIFNPPAASHHGGAWERMIRTIRNVLLSILKEQVPTDEQLRTVMCEAEAIINSRPLTTVSADPNDPAPLTPNHLLTLRCDPTLPPGVFDGDANYARRRWKQIQYLADLFWKRWRTEYLHTLQIRQKWTKFRENLKPGDLVLIMDENAPRCHWKMGVISTVFKDKNKVVRSVEVKTSSSLLVRPITKIILLKVVEELEGLCN